MAWYEQNRWKSTICEHIKKNTMQGFLQHLMRWMGDIDWMISPYDQTHDIEFPVLPYREFLRYLLNMFLTNDHIPPKMYRCLFDTLVHSRELGIFSRLTEDFDTTLLENYTVEQWKVIEQRLCQILKEEIIINGCESMKRAFLSNQLQDIIDDSDIRRSNIFESDLLTQFQGHIVNEQPDDIGILSTYNLCNGLYIKDESLFRKHFDEKLKYRDSIGEYLNVEFIFDRPSDYHYYNFKYLKYEDLRQLLLQPHSMSPVDEGNNRYKNYILQNMMKTDITVTEFIKLAEEFPMCDFRKCLVDDCHDYGMKKLDSYVESLHTIYEYGGNNHRQETIDEVISMISKYTSDTPINHKSEQGETAIERMGDTFQYAIEYGIQPITLLYNQGYPAISVPFYNKHLSFEEFKTFILPLLEIYDSRLVNVLDSVKYSIKVCYVDLVTLLTTDRTNECVRDMDKFVKFFVDEWGISIKYLQHLIATPVLTIEDIIENTKVEPKYSWAKSVFDDDTSKYLVSSLTRRMFSPENVEKYPDFPWDWYEMSCLCPLKYEFIKEYKDKLFAEEKRYIPIYNTSLETIDKMINDDEFCNIVVYSPDGVSQNTNMTIPWFIEKVESCKVPLKKWCLLEVMSIIKPDEDLAAKCIQSWWRLEQVKRRLRILAGEVNEWWFSPDCFPATRVRRLAFESRMNSAPGNNVLMFD